jgi:hypothetical protein
VFSVGLHLEVKRSNVPSEPLNTAPEVPKLAPRADHLRLFASRREIYRASLVPAPTELTTFLGASIIRQAYNLFVSIAFISRF